MTTHPPRMIAIAGNEAGIIDRFVADHVAIGAEQFLIACNGTDDTPAVLQASLDVRDKAKNSSVRITAWRDFGSNRSELLDMAAESPSLSGWDFMLDIDWTFLGDLTVLGEWLATRPVETSIISVLLEGPGGILFMRPLLTRCSQVARYRGRRHEYLDGPVHDVVPLEIGMVTYESKGHRSQVGDRRLFTDDAFELIDEFQQCAATDPGHAARCAFYAAQSFRDAGLIDSWMAWSKRRFEIALGYWQERYVAALWLGRAHRWAGELEESTRWLEKAVMVDPSRPEAVIELAGVALQRGMRGLSWHFTMCASELLGDSPSKSPTWLFWEREATQKWVAYNLALMAPEHGHNGRDLYDNLVELCGPEDVDVQRLKKIYEGVGDDAE